MEEECESGFTHCSFLHFAHFPSRAFYFSEHHFPNPQQTNKTGCQGRLSTAIVMFLFFFQILSKGNSLILFTFSSELQSDWRADILEERLEMSLCPERRLCLELWRSWKSKRAAGLKYWFSKLAASNKWPPYAAANSVIVCLNTIHICFILIII